MLAVAVAVQRRVLEGYMVAVAVTVQHVLEEQRLGVEVILQAVGRPIPLYYYKNYYNNACSECMPAIPIVIPI